MSAAATAELNQICSSRAARIEHLGQQLQSLEQVTRMLKFAVQSKAMPRSSL